jgi:uncharacterized protein (TIGR00255 family)
MAVRSMTGFGRGVAEAGGARATVDVRAVNHRYLDVKLRGAGIAPGLEDAMTTRLRSAIERGSIAISVHVSRDGASAPRIDHAVARAVHGELAGLAAQLGMAGPDLALVLAQPGVIVAGDTERDDAPAVLAALDAAITNLVAMRDIEGKALAAELLARTEDLARLRDAIAERAAALPDQLARKLRERVQRLLADAEPDPARLAQEVALLADRGDVSEELVRLASHLDQVRALIAGPGATGRRLDFLVQEIGRELNTIGSKAAATEISTAVVEAKAVLEKVREQVQNVE